MGFWGRQMQNGRGISKEEAKKRNYFEMLFSKFWDLVKINLLYVACNIPMIIAFLLLAIPLWFQITDLDIYVAQLIKGNVVTVFWMVLPLVPFVLSGPFTAGLTYIVRNFVQRNYVFLFSDFFEHTKKNIKQGFLMNLIAFVVFYVYLCVALFYYVSSHGSIVVLSIFFIIGLTLLIMSFYTFPMIVSFDMKIKDIIKNSLVFTMAKMPQNLLFLIIIVAVHIIALKLSGIWFILMPTILISWTAFTINYYAWYVITKFMDVPKENSDKIFDDNKMEE